MQKKEKLLNHAVLIYVVNIVLIALISTFVDMTTEVFKKLVHRIGESILYVQCEFCVNLVNCRKNRSLFNTTNTAKTL
jgi:hypothetical protein